MVVKDQSSLSSLSHQFLLLFFTDTQHTLFLFRSFSLPFLLLFCQSLRTSDTQHFSSFLLSLFPFFSFVGSSSSDTQHSSSFLLSLFPFFSFVGSSSTDTQHFSSFLLSLFSFFFFVDSSSTDTQHFSSFLLSLFPFFSFAAEVLGQSEVLEPCPLSPFSSYFTSLWTCKNSCSYHRSTQQISN